MLLPEIHFIPDRQGQVLKLNIKYDSGLEHPDFAEVQRELDNAIAIFRGKTSDPAIQVAGALDRYFNIFLREALLGRLRYTSEVKEKLRQLV